MDFFAQQARVRGSSRRLVVLFVLAVIAIVVAIDAAVWLILGHHAADGEPAVSNLLLLFTSSIVVIAGIGLCSLFRIMSLSGGGKTVAEGVGAVAVSTKSPVDSTTTSTPSSFQGRLPGSFSASTRTSGQRSAR